MFSLFCMGIIGWLVYGIFKADLPIILANAVTICLAGIILGFIFFGKKTHRLAHVGLYVSHLESAKTFYCQNLGFKAGKLYQNPEKGFSSYFLYLPNGASLELMNSSKMSDHAGKYEWGHIALSVGSRREVDNMAQELTQRGLPPINGPRTTGDGYYELQIRDPEGNIIEITN
jgi:lactoylglutathione lyase